jgi:hypothetical protein
MQIRLRLVFIGDSVECFQFSGPGQCSISIFASGTRKAAADCARFPVPHEFVPMNCGGVLHDLVRM